MKKMMITLAILVTTAVTGRAMSYEQARNEVLFLTDKMAYELNLTDDQYEAAYEINLDYLMGVTSYDDVYGDYWERRNLDMSYVLLDWQWQTFCAASYFYRPLYWRDGYWHFGIYARYPHRDYFYFGRPVFYASYRGGHAWHVVGGHGWYYGRRDHFRPAGRSHFGMLDRWNRGDFRRHHPNTERGNHRFGGNRNSSTRTTVHHHQGNSHTIGGHGGGRPNNGSFGHRPGGGTSSGTFGGGSGHHGNSGTVSGGSSHHGNSGTVSGGSGHHGNSGSSASSGSFSRGGSTSSGSFGRGGSSTSSGRSSSSSGSFGRSTARSSGGSSSAGSRQGGSHSSRNGSFSRGR
jgi:hypothetical protein